MPQAVPANPGAFSGTSTAVKNQHRQFRIGREFRDPDGLTTQYPLRVPSRVRPPPEPHDLGRRPYGCSEFVEVRIGASDDEVPRLRKLLYLPILTLEQANPGDVSRIWIQSSEPNDKLAREVLVKQQLHRATRLPSLAANSYTARKSSGSSSG